MKVLCHSSRAPYGEPEPVALKRPRTDSCPKPDHQSTADAVVTDNNPPGRKDYASVVDADGIVPGELVSSS